MRPRSVTLLVIISFLIAGTGFLPARAQTPLSEYAARRVRLLDKAEGPVVLFGYAGEDLPLFAHFRQEENFYYLTGHQEPGAALLLIPASPDPEENAFPREMLFLPEQTSRSVIYDGLSLFPDAPEVSERTGFAQVRATAELPEVLQKAAKQFGVFYTLLPAPLREVDSLHAERKSTWLKAQLPDVAWEDIRPALEEMRLIKSDSELAWEIRANEVTREAHLAAMRTVRPGMMEYELAAVMEYEFRRAGCRPGYASIVGSGPNSVVLHYNLARRRMADGELVVLDVGGACGGYTTDITRTLPVSGKFSERQRQIYEIVLGAQKAAIAAVKPGMKLSGDGENSLIRLVREYFRKKGEEIGEDLMPYIYHGLGHYVGLQVHDTGSYSEPLRPGMVITIEPGLYIAKENLGVRIEDVVLVTEDGARLLSGSIPKSVQEVERLMLPGPLPGDGR